MMLTFFKTLFILVIYYTLQTNLIKIDIIYNISLISIISISCMSCIFSFNNFGNSYNFNKKVHKSYTAIDIYPKKETFPYHKH